MKLRGSDTYVGLLEATVCEERAAMVAYLAYTVFVEYQRKGFAFEGCGRIVRHLFEDYGVEAIVAEIAPGTRRPSHWSSLWVSSGSPRRRTRTISKGLRATSIAMN